MVKSARKQRRVSRPAGRERATDKRVEGAALTVTATEAKNRFGPLLDTAIQGGSVVITKHDTPKAVLLSIAAFESLVRSGEPSLNTLSDEFDTLLARMQTSSSRNALTAAFNATPAELGRLAVSNARRRG